MPSLLRPIWGIGLLIHVLALAMPPTTTSAAQPGRPVISDIQVKLFYANSGRFSANLAEKKDLVLWNVVIGEGVGVEGPSENTLLLVTVSGEPKGYLEDLRLQVNAKAGDKTLMEHVCSVGAFNTAGKWYAPFLIYDTGCMPVVVTAKLLSKSASPPVAFTIPFECGE